MDNKEITDINVGELEDLPKPSGVGDEAHFDEASTDESKFTYNYDTAVKTNYWLPAVLFVVTFITTLTAGAMYEGFNPYEDIGHLQAGLPFAVSLMFILGTHELGHYFAARRHNVHTTLPMFLPAPPIEPFILGTFGAVIKMNSPVKSKEAMIDIGAYGPIAGFVAAIIIMVVGLMHSNIAYMPVGGDFSLGLVISGKEDDDLIILTFGSSFLYSMLEYIVFGDLREGTFVWLSSTAFAGWIGLLVTSLNLIPTGQLDGGHILYGLFSKYHRKISLVIIGILICFGFFSWYGWIVWGLMVLFLALKHPPIGKENEKIDKKRIVVAIVSLVILILTFTASPFNIIRYH